MPWTCHIVPLDKTPKEVGDVWLAPYLQGHRRLSPEYKTTWLGNRPPMVIRLPGPTDFCPDFCADDTNSGWQVQGGAAGLSFIPSVNILGTWHGFVTRGEITDDLEGRTYDAMGRLLIPV